MPDFNTSLPRLPCAYQRGTIVYHRLDRDANKGLVVGVEFNLDGSVIYLITWADSITTTERHCEYEISTVASFGDFDDKEEETN